MTKSPPPATKLLFLTDPPPGISNFFKSWLVLYLHDPARKCGMRLTEDHVVI